MDSVIQRFVKIVNDSKNPNDYFVLFILTRGGVEDVEKTENVRHSLGLPTHLNVPLWLQISIE